MSVARVVLTFEGRPTSLERVYHEDQVMARLLEHLCVTRSITRPEQLEMIMDGYVSGSLTQIKVIKPEGNDDGIPF